MKKNTSTLLILGSYSALLCAAFTLLITNVPKQKPDPKPPVDVIALIENLEKTKSETKTGEALAADPDNGPVLMEYAYQQAPDPQNFFGTEGENQKATSGLSMEELQAAVDEEVETLASKFCQNTKL